MDTFRAASYLRVSTDRQNTEKFKHNIEDYAKAKGLGTVDHYEDTVSGVKNWRHRQIHNLILSPYYSDIIIPDLSRVSRSFSQTVEIIEEFKIKGKRLHLINESQIVDPEKNDMYQNMFLGLLGTVAQLERDMCSHRIKDALQELKRKGVKLGRPRSRVSKLDQYRDQIINLLDVGVKQVAIAKQFSVSEQTLSLWIKRNDIKNIVKNNQKTQE
jgi:DNA invertase Pin-like site-specific DNA recombinase